MGLEPTASSSTSWCFTIKLHPLALALAPSPTLVIPHPRPELYLPLDQSYIPTLGQSYSQTQGEWGGSHPSILPIKPIVPAPRVK